MVLYTQAGQVVRVPDFSGASTPASACPDGDMLHCSVFLCLSRLTQPCSSLQVNNNKSNHIKQLACTWKPTHK